MQLQILVNSLVNCKVTVFYNTPASKSARPHVESVPVSSGIPHGVLSFINFGDLVSHQQRSPSFSPSGLFHFPGGEFLLRSRALVARDAHNVKVVGSIPTSAKSYCCPQCGDRTAPAWSGASSGSIPVDGRSPLPRPSR